MPAFQSNSVQFSLFLSNFIHFGPILTDLFWAGKASSQFLRLFHSLLCHLLHRRWHRGVGIAGIEGDAAARRDGLGDG